MNNNCQEYNFSMQSLLLRCSKPFHFCSKDTHITFLLINFSVMSGFTYYYAFCSKWLTQIFVVCNIFNKGEINEVRIKCTLKRIQE